METGRTHPSETTGLCRIIHPALLKRGAGHPPPALHLCAWNSWIYTSSGVHHGQWRNFPVPLNKAASPGVELGGETVTVIAVTTPADLRRLEKILAHTRWSLEAASCLSDVLTRVQQHSSAVIISDATLSDGSWKDLLAHTLMQPAPPPVIVAAHHADDRLWMEVLNSGGYNVVGKPFQDQEVFRVISMAWLHGRKRVRALAQAR